MGKKKEKIEENECLYCGSTNVVHWVTNGYREVIHRCSDCKAQWADTVGD